jgi:4-oxalmesaconate hydratase
MRVGILFGTEKPGTGSVKDLETGRWVDDIHLLTEDIEWLDDAERDQIFAGNAQQLFKL